MGQHRTKGYVSNAPDAWNRGVVLIVDDDSPLLVDFDANSLQIKTFGVWLSANGDETDVGSNLSRSDVNPLRG